jgi:hypothetical protein
LPDFLQLINQNQELVNNLWMSDEAHFHLPRFVNKQNFRYIYPGLLTNKISVTGLPQTPYTFMRDNFTVPESKYGA